MVLYFWKAGEVCSRGGGMLNYVGVSQVTLMMIGLNAGTKLPNCSGHTWQSKVLAGPSAVCDTPGRTP